MSAPKVIIRYFIGSSGKFITSLIQSLIEPIDLVEAHRAHLNFEHYRFHTYTRPGMDMSIYDRYTTKIDQTEQELESGAEYFRQNIVWDIDYQTGKEPPFYILSCHAYNPEPMLRGIDNSRLVNITFDLDDLDQISYNWITKNVIEDRNQQDFVAMLRFLSDRWPRQLPPLRMEDIRWDDVEQLTFINKFLNLHTSYVFNQVSKKLSTDPRSFNIAFKDIASRRIVNQLDEIADFVGITISAERRQNAVKLIDKYSAAQKPVPWGLKLEDYKK